SLQETSHKIVGNVVFRKTQKKPDVSNAHILGITRKRTIVDYWKSFDPTLTRNGRGKRYQRDRLSRTFGPMARLWRAMRNNESVLVMTRGLREPRAFLTGNLVAFDRYWNLIVANTREYSISLKNSTLCGPLFKIRLHNRILSTVASSMLMYVHLHSLSAPTAPCEQYGGPNRSRRRRKQRQQAMLRFGQLQNSHLDSTNTKFNKPSSNPVEIGDLIPLDSVTDDALVWGGDPMFEPVVPTDSLPLSSNYTDDCELTVGSRSNHDMASQANCVVSSTVGSQWIPSIAQLTEKAYWSVENPTFDTETSQNKDHVKTGPIAEQRLHGQLFIRGSNVVSVRFLP
ncbi:uncharacterized protein DEA37_0003551, partial [Paragonimus westermani]